MSIPITYLQCLLLEIWRKTKAKEKTIHDVTQFTNNKYPRCKLRCLQLIYLSVCNLFSGHVSSSYCIAVIDCLGNKVL